MTRCAASRTVPVPVPAPVHQLEKSQEARHQKPPSDSYFLKFWAARDYSMRRGAVPFWRTTRHRSTPTP